MTYYKVFRRIKDDIGNDNSLYNSLNRHLDKNTTLTLLYSYITNIAFSSHNVKTKRFKDEEKDKDISSDYHIYDVFNGDDIISSNNDINEFNLVKDEEKDKDISSDNHIYDIFNGDDIISSNNDINEFNLVKDEEKDKDTSSDNHINDVFNGDDDIKLKISEYISNNKRIDDKNNLDVNIPENIILDEKLEGLHFKNFDSLTLVEMLINPSNIVQYIPRGIKNNVFFTVMKTKKKTMQTSYDDDCGAWTGKKTSSTKRYFVIEDTIKGPYLLMENKLYKSYNSYKKKLSIDIDLSSANCRRTSSSSHRNDERTDYK
ncbi:unnamed protein product [Gordionus sp. m RMFG-2023]